jgi:hypothetical protein
MRITYSVMSLNVRVNYSRRVSDMIIDRAGNQLYLCKLVGYEVFSVLYFPWDLESLRKISFSASKEIPLDLHIISAILERDTRPLDVKGFTYSSSLIFYEFRL